MHELSLMDGIFSRAEAALKPYGSVKVNSLTVRIGPLANIMPAAFDFAFEALSAGGIFEGAQLITEPLPITARCQACDREFASRALPLICPDCAAREVMVTGGDEVYLASIDFNEEGEAIAD
ncbi:MAG: hydrogenase maturation nickel metallochaperone HypA [Clostridia bacterium]|nr:hydrogenase maturation nickel metallochaperone HypA [Clostridia bacterium]